LIHQEQQSEALHVTFRSSKTSSRQSAHRPGRDYSLGLPLSAQFSCQFAGFNGGAKNTALAPLSGARSRLHNFYVKEETRAAPSLFFGARRTQNQCLRLMRETKEK
jgi:hypothetical protein